MLAFWALNVEIEKLTLTKPNMKITRKIYIYVALLVIEAFISISVIKQMTHYYDIILHSISGSFCSFGILYLYIKKKNLWFQEEECKKMRKSDVEWNEFILINCLAAPQYWLVRDIFQLMHCPFWCQVLPIPIAILVARYIVKYLFPSPNIHKNDLL